MMRDWKELLLKGLPLYEPTKSHRTKFQSSTSQDPTELKKQEILNNLDYDEYAVSLKHEYIHFALKNLFILFSIETQNCLNAKELCICYVLEYGRCVGMARGGWRNKIIPT